MSSDRSSAHALAQRKTMLDNSAECLAAYRESLRSNMHAVRKEITETFSQQMSLLRARETELLRNLEVEVNTRETHIDNQQKDLHKLIRQCDSSKVTSKKEVSQNTMDHLDGLAHIDILPKGCGSLYFERDLFAFREALENFGRIRFEKKNTMKFTGETLPMSMEDYEEDSGMTHKSVHSFGKQPNVIASPEQVENIRKWLTYVPGKDLNQDYFLKLVNEDRTDSETETNSMCSSFDVIPSVPQDLFKHACPFDIPYHEISPEKKKEQPQEHVYEFTKEFLNTLNSDAACWLLGSSTTPTISKQSFSDFVSATAHKYEFQTVMENIQNSDIADWYLPSCSKTQEETENTDEEDEEMKDVTPRIELPEMDEAFAKNLENLAIFSIRSGSEVGKGGSLPVTNKDVDAASAGDQHAKKKILAFGHHLWTVMHN